MLLREFAVLVSVLLRAGGLDAAMGKAVMGTLGQLVKRAGECSPEEEDLEPHELIRRLEGEYGINSLQVLPVIYALLQGKHEPLDLTRPTPFEHLLARMQRGIEDNKRKSVYQQLIRSDSSETTSVKIDVPVRILFSTRIHTRDVYCISVSGEFNTALTGADDGVVKLTDINTGRVVGVPLIVSELSNKGSSSDNYILDCKHTLLKDIVVVAVYPHTILIIDTSKSFFGRIIGMFSNLHSSVVRLLKVVGTVTNMLLVSICNGNTMNILSITNVINKYNTVNNGEGEPIIIEDSDLGENDMIEFVCTSTIKNISIDLRVKEEEAKRIAFISIDTISIDGYVLLALTSVDGMVRVFHMNEYIEWFKSPTKLETLEKVEGMYRITREDAFIIFGAPAIESRFSSNGRYIAVCGNSNTINIYDLIEDKICESTDHSCFKLKSKCVIPKSILISGGSIDVANIAFSDDSATIMISGSTEIGLQVCNGRTFTVMFDVQTGRCVQYALYPDANQSTTILPLTIKLPNYNNCSYFDGFAVSNESNTLVIYDKDGVFIKSFGDELRDEQIDKYTIFDMATTFSKSQDGGIICAVTSCGRLLIFGDCKLHSNYCETPTEQFIKEELAQVPEHTNNALFLSQTLSLTTPMTYSLQESADNKYTLDSIIQNPSTTVIHQRDNIPYVWRLRKRTYEPPAPVDLNLLVNKMNTIGYTLKDAYSKGMYVEEGNLDNKSIIVEFHKYTQVQPNESQLQHEFDDELSADSFSDPSYQEQGANNIQESYEANEEEYQTSESSETIQRTPRTPVRRVIKRSKPESSEDSDESYSLEIKKSIPSKRQSILTRKPKRQNNNRFYNCNESITESSYDLEDETEDDTYEEESSEYPTLTNRVSTSKATALMEVLVPPHGSIFPQVGEYMIISGRDRKRFIDKVDPLGFGDMVASIGEDIFITVRITSVRHKYVSINRTSNILTTVSFEVSPIRDVAKAYDMNEQDLKLILHKLGGYPKTEKEFTTMARGIGVNQLSIIVTLDLGMACPRLGGFIHIDTLLDLRAEYVPSRDDQMEMYVRDYDSNKGAYQSFKDINTITNSVKKLYNKHNAFSVNIESKKLTLNNPLETDPELAELLKKAKSAIYKFNENNPEVISLLQNTVPIPAIELNSPARNREERLRKQFQEGEKRKEEAQLNQKRKEKMDGINKKNSDQPVLLFPTNLFQVDMANYVQDFRDPYKRKYELASILSDYLAKSVVEEINMVLAVTKSGKSLILEAGEYKVVKDGVQNAFSQNNNNEMCPYFSIEDGEVAPWEICANEYQCTIASTKIQDIQRDTQRNLSPLTRFAILQALKYLMIYHNDVAFMYLSNPTKGKTKIEEYETMCPVPISLNYIYIKLVQNKYRTVDAVMADIGLFEENAKTAEMCEEAIECAHHFVGYLKCLVGKSVEWLFRSLPV